jgi:hypothetical protein
MAVVVPCLSVWSSTYARNAGTASGGGGVILPFRGAAKLM